MARNWESIICYEDRSDHLTTSRWRLSGVKTLEGGQNTDDGVVWLKTTSDGDDVTCALYKDDGLASGNQVASATAVDVSGCDNTGENAVEVTFTAANSSGLSGSMWIHSYEGDDSCPVQVALCTDEDLDSLWDAIGDLPGYDETHGLAEFIRVAGDDVLGKVARIFEAQVGGYGTAEAWYITDASRAYPDLRKIANPGQLRIACAYHALEIALGRSHQRADDTMYSSLRDYFREQYDAALSALVLAIKAGSGDNASDDGRTSIHRMSRA